MSGRLQALALIAAIPAVIVAVALVAGAGDSDDAGAGNPDSRAIDYEQALAGAPPELARHYEHGDELIPGGLDEFERRIESLEGFPVVANVWASWCLPCRAEFPFLQEQSARHGTEVAFLGVNSQDSDDAARTFLDEFPVPYPSISDPDREVWDDLGAAGLPATAFYDSSGELVHLKQGEYRSEEDLAADIERHAR